MGQKNGQNLGRLGQKKITKIKNGYFGSVENRLELKIRPLDKLSRPIDLARPRDL